MRIDFLLGVFLGMRRLDAREPLVTSLKWMMRRLRALDTVALT
jgi:hypothetical protein